MLLIVTYMYAKKILVKLPLLDVLFHLSSITQRRHMNVCRAWMFAYHVLCHSKRNSSFLVGFPPHHPLHCV